MTSLPPNRTLCLLVCGCVFWNYATHSANNWKTQTHSPKPPMQLRHESAISNWAEIRDKRSSGFSWVRGRHDEAMSEQTVLLSNNNMPPKGNMIKSLNLMHYEGKTMKMLIIAWKNCPSGPRKEMFCLSFFGVIPFPLIDYSVLCKELKLGNGDKIWQNQLQASRGELYQR